MGFYEELSKYYDIIFPLGKAQLKFMKKRFKGKGKILDLAAGTGNYSIALSKLGYNVVSIDLDEEMINIIEEKNRKEQTNVRAFKLDMKNIYNLDEYKFDGMICIGNSIVHLDNTEQIKDVLSNMYQLLNENGVIVLQIVNYDRILRYNIKELPLIDRQENGVKFIRTYELKDEKILFKTKLIVNNERTYNNCVKLYPLQSHEIIRILKEVGFKDINLYGGFHESKFTLDSFPLVVEAHKKLY